MGTRGAIVFDGEDFFFQKAESTDAIDTMGAGDSFLTAFSTEYLSMCREGANHQIAIKKSLQKAAAFAREVCMQEGAFGHGAQYEEG